LSRFLWTDIIY